VIQAFSLISAELAHDEHRSPPIFLQLAAPADAASHVYQQRRAPLKPIDIRLLSSAPKE
jgi:hypothetical protein